MDIVYIYFIYYLSHHSYTNLCYKVSITLLIFSHILLDHASLLNSKKPFFYLLASQMIISNESSPSGLVWDGDNYSCAYDALFTILYEIWSTDTKTWKIRFKEINQHHLKSLSACFKKYMNGQANCEYSEPSIDDSLEFVLHEKDDSQKSTSQWLGSLEHETHERCPQCLAALMQPISFKTIPSVLVFEINSRNIKVSKTLKFEQEGETVVLDVRGLIYHGDFQFTSHIIGTDGIVWYHDGVTAGSSCEIEGDFDKFSSKKLLKCKRKQLILVVYVRI